jgi:hypothetical protein
MNIIFAKHGVNEPREFCFSVPDNMVGDIQKGMMLYVETMHGNTVAYATTGVISGAGAEDVALQRGAYFPLKSVLSFWPTAVSDALIAQITWTVKKAVLDALNPLPF